MNDDILFNYLVAGAILLLVVAAFAADQRHFVRAGIAIGLALIQAAAVVLLRTGVI